MVPMFSCVTTSCYLNIEPIQILFVRLVGFWKSGDRQLEGTRGKKVEVMKGEEGEGVR